jgi:hypothetical protein
MTQRSWRQSSEAHRPPFAHRSARPALQPRISLTLVVCRSTANGRNPQSGLRQNRSRSPALGSFNGGFGSGRAG